MARPVKYKEFDAAAGYQTYKNKYAAAVIAEAKRQGFEVTYDEALKMSLPGDSGGLFTKAEFEYYHRTAYNEQKARVEAGEIKSAGNIINKLVAEQRYVVSPTQQGYIKTYMKRSEEKDIEDIRSELTAKLKRDLRNNKRRVERNRRSEEDIIRLHEKRLREEIKNIKKTYKELRSSEWKRTGVDLSAASRRNQELKEQKPELTSAERQRIIAKEFFLTEDEYEYYYVKDE